MKKVCVSTFCEWSSYGSILQAIGLKKALGALGFDSFVIRDNPAPNAEKKFSFALSGNPKKLLINLLSVKNQTKREARYKRSVQFIRDNVDVKYYNDYETLCKNVPEADYYITGSDQVWHPLSCNPAFFLDFLTADKKRLSYAASMGVSHIPSEKKSSFSLLAAGIDEISVRESDAAHIIRECTGRNAEVHIDPTFLVSRDEWAALERKYLVNKPYILVYALYWDKALNSKLKKLHRKTGYDILALCNSGVTKVWANKKVFDADPGQFLYLIDNAQAVISSSFHGVALALNFNKKVVPVINPNAPARIRSLVELLGVSQLSIEEAMNFDIKEYGKINERIKEEKERSMNYLRGQLLSRE